nr:MAG TPA: DnaD-like replication protein [Caudoviricetes sp.]
MMPYVQLPADMEEALGLLGDAERGRLVLAMLQYNRTGESVQLAGTERVLWPMIRERMDRSALAYEQRKQAGERGGRPKKNRAEQKWEQRPEPVQAAKPAEKRTDPSGDGFMDEGEALRIAAEHQQVLDLAEQTGFPRNDYTRKALIDLYSQYPLAWLLEAMEKAAAADASNLRYLRGILASFQRQGGPDETRGTDAAEAKERDKCPEIVTLKPGERWVLGG